MAPLSAASKLAIERLRAYVPPPDILSSSGVEVPGQAALPGGKVDFEGETPFQTARREAFEEIGLALLDQELPPPLCIEHLCELPLYLARTEVVVCPCVALLHAGAACRASALDIFVPRLDPNEVSALFTAPFHQFLQRSGGAPLSPELQPPKGAEWYEGRLASWHGLHFHMHSFQVPLAGQRVTTAVIEEEEEQDSGRLPAPLAGGEEAPVASYRVFGMTARIVLDAARLAYGEAPDFEHEEYFGDEELISKLVSCGALAKEQGKAETNKL
ncbi:MAG: hypothetical protein M1829_006447 [Trizodia sp. TS-e1964]|nr:MAG: hypothetical protein M1829_006447 [Trizodia sp. TS-e1964]